MEAAQVASSRGHQVVLYERQHELGGTLRCAAAPSFKADMKRYLEWMVKKTLQAPVEVKLSTEATADSLRAARPDVLIMAIGAEPIFPDIPGIKKPGVVWAGDVHLGKSNTGKTVVVAGAGMTGCETALHLAQQGKKVTIIDIVGESEIAKDAPFTNILALKELLNQHSVEFRTEVKLEEITDKGVQVIDKSWRRYEIPADTIVLSLGVRPLLETVRAFQGMAREVYAVGDCSSSGPRNLMAAIHDAFHVAAEI